MVGQVVGKDERRVRDGVGHGLLLLAEGGRNGRIKVDDLAEHERQVRIVEIARTDAMKFLRFAA